MNKITQITGIILFSSLLSSCWTGFHYEMRSIPSLIEQPDSTETTLGPPFTFNSNTLSIEGVRLHIWLTNIKVLKNYSTALLVPIKTFDAELDQSSRGKGYVGNKPFEIEMYFMTDEGATFSPWETGLQFGNSNETIYPANVYYGDSVECGERITGVPATANHPIERSASVPLVSAALIDESEKDYTAHWTCLRLLFDVTTPDPSQKFRLRLGNIVTPSEKSIRPMIYFSPVVNQVITH